MKYDKNNQYLGILLSNKYISLISNSILFFFFNIITSLPLFSPLPISSILSILS